MNEAKIMTVSTISIWSFLNEATIVNHIGTVINMFDQMRARTLRIKVEEALQTDQ